MVTFIFIRETDSQEREYLKQTVTESRQKSLPPVDEGGGERDSRRGYGFIIHTRRLVKFHNQTVALRI